MTKHVDVITQISKSQLLDAIDHLIGTVDWRELSIYDAERLESYARVIRIKLKEQSPSC